MRASGILMPVFSLPSRWHVGNIGSSAYQFIDFLSKSGQKYWQFLPLCPVDRTFSPYQSVSFFAGETAFIDPELLVTDGLISRELTDTLKTPKDFTFVDYKAAKENEKIFLSEAFKNFKGSSDFERFKAENEFWVYDYALYSALKKNLNVSWREFPSLLKNRETDALNEAKEKYRNDFEYYLFVQYEFFKQWEILKNYAHQKGVKLIGDLPIYAPLDSADVWAHREDFMLKEDGQPELVAGTPPDAFSRTGQLWGSPVYNFENMKKEKNPFCLWKQRICHSAKMFDTVRIDHFRAFQSFYAVQSGEKTAKNGRWIDGPDIEFFDLLSEEFSNVSVIAEDLGLITAPVKKLLKKTGFSGMRVLQFAFDGDEKNPYLPYNYEKNTVAYLGTHDNPTVMAWYDGLSLDEKERCRKYIPHENEAFNWAAVRTLMSSVADTVIFTMQDIMGLKESGRINTPATTENNWIWRMTSGCANDWLSGILNDITKTYGR